MVSRTLDLLFFFSGPGLGALACGPWPMDPSHGALVWGPYQNGQTKYPLHSTGHRPSWAAALKGHLRVEFRHLSLSDDF